MSVRFSEEGEVTGAVKEEGEVTGAVKEEDIVIRVRGAGGVRNVGGEKSENTRKPQVYIRTKCPQPMGTMSQNTQPIKHSPSNTAHQTQPSQDENLEHVSSETI